MVGYFRGFSKEFSSVVTLIVAIFLSYIFAPLVSPLIIAKFTYSKILIDIIVRFLLFIIIYFIFFLIMHKAQNTLSKKIPSSINSSLGFMLSFCKIYFIFSLLFFGIIYVYSHGLDTKKTEKIGPQWLTNSISYDFLDFGKDIVEPIFVSVTKKLMPSFKKDDSPINDIKKIQDIIDNDLKNDGSIEIRNLQKNNIEIDASLNHVEKIQKITNVDLKNSGSREKGYSPEDIQNLNKLIDNSSN